MNIFYEKNDIIIENTDKSKVIYDFSNKNVSIENFSISAQGEYEKSGILAEVKEKSNLFFYKINIEGYKVIIITDYNFELNEDILSFFGDVDVLLLPGDKGSVKVFENIEAKVVIPYGEEKDIFLNSISQNKEEIEIYKVKGSIDGDNTEFINLGIKY